MQLRTTRFFGTDFSAASVSLYAHILQLMFLSQNHLNRANANRKLNLGSKSNSKLAYVELQEEIISAKVRETKMKATNIEFKQRLLELETSVSHMLWSCACG